MNIVKNIAVFCGSSMDVDAVFSDDAYKLGKCLAEKGIGLVYGGGARGLMGACARGCSDNGGHVTGVIPKFLKEVPTVRAGLYEKELIVTEDMHTRKKIMCEKADAFIALPGGIGTYEEIFEQLAWLQLRLHDKVCGFLNTNGFYNNIVEFLENSVRCGFTKKAVFDTICFESDCNVLIDRILRTEVNLPPKVE